MRNFWEKVDRWNPRIEDTEFNIMEMLEDMWLIERVNLGNGKYTLTINTDLWSYVVYRIAYLRRKSK